MPQLLLTAYPNDTYLNSQFSPGQIITQLNIINELPIRAVTPRRASLHFGVVQQLIRNNCNFFANINFMLVINEIGSLIGVAQKICKIIRQNKR
jgi:hypothetical protein